MFADQLDGAIHVVAGFGMETDQRGAGFGEQRHQLIHRFNHQVYVDRRLDPVMP